MKHWPAIAIGLLIALCFAVTLYGNYWTCVIGMWGSNQILEHELGEMKEACWNRSNPFSLFR